MERELYFTRVLEQQNIVHIFGRVAFGERQPDVLRGTVTVRKDDAITFMSACSHWKKLERSFSCLFVQLTLIAAVRTGVYIYTPFNSSSPL